MHTFGCCQMFGMESMRVMHTSGRSRMFSHTCCAVCSMASLVWSPTLLSWREGSILCRVHGTWSKSSVVASGRPPPLLVPTEPSLCRPAIHWLTVDRWSRVTLAVSHTLATRPHPSVLPVNNNTWRISRFVAILDKKINKYKKNTKFH